MNKQAILIIAPIIKIFFDYFGNKINPYTTLFELIVTLAACVLLYLYGKIDRANYLGAYDRNKDNFAYQKVVNCLPGGVAIVKANGNIAYTNKYLYRIFKANRDTITNQLM